MYASFVNRGDMTSLHVGLEKTATKVHLQEESKGK